MNTNEDTGTNSFIFLVICVTTMIALVTTLAQMGKNENFSAKCNSMLKSKSYMAKYTGEWEELNGSLFCLDRAGNSHKYKAL